MTPEAQRIAIAEACGNDMSGLKRGANYCACPDYLNDLNAVHEAECLLLRNMNKLWYPYCKRLHETTNGIGEGATAAQRAEAFLRTLGLWKDET